MPALRYLYKTTALAALALSLSACSSLGGNKKEKLAYVERPAETIYEQGFKRMERADWDAAKLHFEEVERQHPVSYTHLRAHETLR